MLLGVEKLTVEAALAAPAGDRTEKTWSATYRGRRRPRARALRLLVRALPALVGRLRRRARRAAAARGARLRRRLPAADPPDRPLEPQGAQQRARGGAGRSGQPVGDRLRARAGTTRSTRSSARSAQFEQLVAAAKKHRHRDRARLRDPVLARPPVAEGASRVVQPPARRHAEVRREPAEALPGHLQRQLRLRGLAGSLGGAARRRAARG